MHTKEMVFQQNLLENAYFITMMCGPAMFRPASSDFWKAPLDPSHHLGLSIVIRGDWL